MRLATLFALTSFVLAGAARTAPTRTVSGVVTDNLGNALPGAVVEIENTRSMAVGSYITQKDGRFFFHQLSTDNAYTLRARYRALWSKPRLLNKFTSGARVTIDLRIRTQ
jgi:carboxypeptidase family protein